jgi:hypothetical protein
LPRWIGEQALSRNPIHFKESPYDVFKAISDGYGTPSTHAHTPSHIAATTFGQESWMVYNSKRFCNTRQFRVPYYGSVFMAFPFSKSFPLDLLEKMNSVINEYFQVLIHIQQHYVDSVRKTENCGTTGSNTGNTVDDAKALNVQNMSGLGIVYAVGVLLALGAMVFELMIITKRANNVRIVYLS